MAVGCAVPVLFSRGNERGIARADAHLFALAGNIPFAAGYEQHLIAGMGVELVLCPVVEVDLRKVVVGAFIGADNGLSADFAAVEDRGVGGSSSGTEPFFITSICIFILRRYSATLNRVCSVMSCEISFASPCPRSIFIHLRRCNPQARLARCQIQKSVSGALRARVGANVQHRA